MKARNILRIVFPLLIFVSVAEAQQFDAPALERLITENLAEAGKTFNMDECDAIILRNEYNVEWSEDGRLTTELNRIVWIASKPAISKYADNRIQYDDSRQAITCHILSTWRDGIWIHSGETARVKTLPFAIRRCPDYSDMRDMMLLHDGIELPCVLVLSYTIEDKQPFRRGADGLWLPQMRNPVVESIFHLSAPMDKKPFMFASVEIPPSSISTDSVTGLETRTFTMRHLPAQPIPHTADPAAYLPHVSWSTWRDWDGIARDLSSAFHAALILDASLKDSLEKVIEGSRVIIEKAERITDFIDRSTRFVNYAMPSRAFSPRHPQKTFNSAYCDRLDRVVLAGALFQEAGFTVFPVFRGEGYGDINEGVPTVSRMDGIALWISGEDLLEAYFDPASCRLQNGFAPVFGRTVWIPGSRDNEPRLTLGGQGMESQIDLRLELSFDVDKKEWCGRGFYCASNGFNAYDQMSGLGSQVRDFLENALCGVIEDAKIQNYNPVTFHRFNMTLGFDFTAPMGEKDGYDRYTLLIDDPGGGLFDNFPGDVELYRENRESPVNLFGIMEQTVELTLDADGWQTVYIPHSSVIVNDIGQFQLGIEHSDDEITIKRQLRINRTNIPPDSWHLLRDLGLADKNERNRTLILERSE